MKRILLLLTFFPATLFCQNIQWVKTWGDILTDFTQFVRVDSAGNIYVAGSAQGTVNFGHSTITSTNQFYYVAKFDSTGNNLWATQVYPNAYAFTGNDFELNSLGEPYLAGAQLISGQDYGSIVKLTSTGSIDFQFQVPFASYIQTIDFDSANNYLIAGYYSSDAKGFIAYFTASDSNAWNINFRTGGNGNPSCARYTSDNGYLLASTFSDTMTLTDIYGHSILLQTSNILSTDGFIAKFDSSSNLLWAKPFNSNYRAEEITVNKAANTAYVIAFDENNEVAYLDYFDSLGNNQWIKEIMGASIFTWNPHDLIVHNNSLYLLGGGVIFSNANGTDGYFVFNRYDLDGNLTGSLASPNGLELTGGGISFTGNNIILSGGVVGSGLWGNQSITGDGTNQANAFIAKMDEINLSPATDIVQLFSTNIGIAPNPAINILQIRNIPGGTPITIYDMLGRCMIKTKAESGITNIDVSQLANGIYMVNGCRFIKE